MSMIGTVTDIVTDGYIEIDVWGNGQSSHQRCVAQVNEKVLRGDVVEIRPIEARNDRIAALAYILVPFLFVMGILFNHGTAGERILSGAILALMGFVVAWLVNRRARMRRLMKYEVIRILQKKSDPFR